MGQPGGPPLHDAFLLHRRHYRETSLLVDAFSREQGIVRLLAKGALRGKTGRFGALQPFMPLSLAWIGRSELATLAAAESRGRVYSLTGTALFCGFYLNELLLRLLPERDPHPQVFAAYEQALAGLQGGGAVDAVLRGFELALLQEIGYGLLLDCDAATGAPIKPECHYDYLVEQGPVLAPPGAQTIRGATLLGLRDGCLDGAVERGEAKRLMRRVINHHLGGKPLQSRALFVSAPCRRPRGPVLA